MQADAEGFLYPVVDASACLHCYLCERVCPVQQRMVEHYDVIKETSEACALICADADLHGRVGSGGAFSLMARHILQEGGAVVGAAWTADWLVEHVVVHSWEEYVRLCGTKYLQSNPGTTLKQTRELLQAGRRVWYRLPDCRISPLSAKGLSKSHNGEYRLLWLPVSRGMAELPARFAAGIPPGGNYRCAIP